MKKEDFNHDKLLEILKSTFPNNEWIYSNDFVYCGYFGDLIIEVWVGESDFKHHYEGFMRLEVEIDGIDRKFNEITFYPKGNPDYDWDYHDLIPVIAKAILHERSQVNIYLSELDKAINACMNKIMPTSKWH